MTPVDPLPDDEHSSWTPRVTLADVMTWPRATSRQFGCMLERAGQRDPDFNCTARKPAKGDPCRDVAHYTHGPAFPAALLPQVGRWVRAVNLTWEHGDLQGVVVELEPGIDDAAIAHMFDLSASTPGHANVMSTNIQQCSQNGSCLVLQGFDHMGAGDVDCGH